MIGEGKKEGRGGRGGRRGREGRKGGKEGREGREEGARLEYASRYDFFSYEGMLC